MARVRRSKTWALFGLTAGAIAALVVVLVVARTHAREPAGLPRSALLPEASGALAVLAMHYVPSMDSNIRDTYVDFLRVIEPDVNVRFVIARGSAQDGKAALMSLISEADPSGALARRIQIVESPGPITTWSKDRALVMRAPSRDAPTLLLIPAEPSSAWPARHNDWLTPGSIARTSGGRYREEVAPFDFDAGDFAVAGDRVLVDANLLDKNRHRGIGDTVELRKRLAAWLRSPVAVLGLEPGDTPRHHLSMYMTPLQDDVVLVGDPRLARALVGDGFRPGELSVESGEPLVADFSEATTQRFDRAANDLRKQGFRVERIPNVPFDDKTYFSYTNGVYETFGGRRIAYVPMYGNDVLDTAARDAYEGLGWEVRSIRVQKIYLQHGTIGCLVNVLERR